MMSPKILPKLTDKDIIPERSSTATTQPAAAHVPQNLEFVNLPDNLKLDVAARRRVRSHVARDFRRRPRAATATATATTSTTNTGCSASASASASATSSNSIDVDHINVAKSIARDVVVAPPPGGGGGGGQKHRFRFGQQGLQETGRQSRKRRAVAAGRRRRGKVSTEEKKEGSGGGGSQDTSSSVAASPPPPHPPPPPTFVPDINVLIAEPYPGGFGIQMQTQMQMQMEMHPFPGLEETAAAPIITPNEDFNLSHSLDSAAHHHTNTHGPSHNPDFMWDDEFGMVTNQSFEENNQYQYFTSPQTSNHDHHDESQEKGKLVRRGGESGDYGGNNTQVRHMNLATAGTGNLDPFSTLPIMDSSSRTQALMHHFHLRIMASPLMMNPRKEWFSIAIQDQALFHVALSHAAGNLSLLTQKGDSTEALMHRMEAIRIINERLNDASSGISDGTIGAVASIASYEATNGTIEGVRTHMNGLEQMVRTRGGFHQGGFSAHLRRLIAWADLNAANALSTAPRFPPLSDRKELRIDQFAIDPIAFQLYTTPADDNPNPLAPLGTTQTTTTTVTAATNPTATITTPADIQALPPKVAYCFLTLRQLSRLLAINGPKAVIRMDHTWYSDMAYTVQRRLMHLASLDLPTSSASSPNSPSSSIPALTSCPPSQYNPNSTAHFPPQQKFTTTASLSRPCCLAALIYLECCIREVHPRSRLVATLVSDLKAALLTLRGRASASASRLVFWALAVGVAATGADARLVSTATMATGFGDVGVGVGIGSSSRGGGGVRSSSSSDDGKAEDLHAWFVTQLGSLAPVLGVRGWEGARAILRGVLWPGRESELTRALVWSEMEMADSRVDCWTVGSE